MRAKVLVGVMAGAMAIMCADASAATYCVPAHSGCTGTEKTTLAAAVVAANGTSEPDDIQLGAGTFQGGVNIGAYPVHIYGLGRDTTKIEGGGGTYGVYMAQPDSSISDLTIHELAGGHPIGLYLAGSAQGVVVDLRDNPTDSSTAVSLHDDGSFVDGAALNSLGTAFADYGLSVYGVGDALVSNVQAQGRYALTTGSNGTKTLRFVTATGNVYGLNAGAQNTVLEDSVVKGAPVVGYTGIGATADVLVAVRHVTVNGFYLGVVSGHDGLTVHMVASNSAVVGGGPDPETPDVSVAASGTGVGVMDIDYSFFRAAHALLGAGGGTETLNRGTHNVDGADAKLLDLAGGDLRPRFDSPLIDAGDPVPGGGEPMADLAGEFRAVNGRTDIGAFEYGRHAPFLSASASPRTVLVGTPVRFTASASDVDPGEVPVVTWAFDDGTTALGTDVSHAFKAAGTHTATATATDPAGASSATSMKVVVNAPPFVRPTVAPNFVFTKLVARRGVVLVRLRCSPVAVDCHGSVQLQLARRAVALGKARYSILNGTTKAIRVKLTKSARRRLAHARHGLRVAVVTKPDGAPSRRKTVRLRGR